MCGTSSRRGTDSLSIYLGNWDCSFDSTQCETVHGRSDESVAGYHGRGCVTIRIGPALVDSATCVGCPGEIEWNNRSLRLMLAALVHYPRGDDRHRDRRPGLALGPH